MTVRYLTISWFYKYTSRQILKWFYLFSARLFLRALLVKFVLNMSSETGRKRKKSLDGNTSPLKKHAFTKKSIEQIAGHVSPALQKKKNIIIANRIMKNNALVFTMDGSYILPVKQMMDDHNAAVMRDLGCQSVHPIRGENGEAKTIEVGKKKTKCTVNGFFSSNGDREPRTDEEIDDAFDKFHTGISKYTNDPNVMLYPYKPYKGKTLKFSTLDEVLLDADVVNLIMAEYGLEAANLAEFASQESLVGEYFADVNRGTKVLLDYANGAN